MIWFFGGSTMFGFNVTDAETIPSQLVTFVMTNHYSLPRWKLSTSSALLFQFTGIQIVFQLLDEQPAPDIAIFFDGLNDFWLYNNTYYRETYFTKLASLFKEGVFELPSIHRQREQWKSKTIIFHLHKQILLLNNYLQVTELIKRKSTSIAFNPYL